ncbi:MAG: hypothetical protein AB1457_17330 [Chloroflexota bacterium]
MKDRFPSLRHLLLDVRNRLDYPLRQWFRWKRAGFRITPRPAADPFAALPPEDRPRAAALAERLVHDYHLHDFAAQTTPINYRENLFYLHLLESALEASRINLPESLRAADIGPSHWFYVQALAALLRWWQTPQPRRIDLQGYEIDAYRVYADLHSRYDHALGHIRGLPGVTYIPQGFTVQPAAFHLIFMLFPFVFSKDHLEWGLPGSLFQPRRLLQDAWKSLQPGGLLVIVNQGEEEHTAQRTLLEAEGIPIRTAFRHDPLLFRYSLDRFVLTACRNG